jgi:hypothetical protein
VDVQLNLGNLDFKRAIRNSKPSPTRPTSQSFTTAGHGIEIGGVNYLIPIDARAPLSSPAAFI